MTLSSERKISLALAVVGIVYVVVVNLVRGTAT
jgi:hypothetical protein